MSAMDLPAGVTQDQALDYFDKKMTTELLRIFNECGVSVGLQYKLGQHFTSVKKFSTYADTRSDVRAALKADHSLEATGQETRAAVAAVVSAWESCREFSTKESGLKAEARVLGVSRPITQTEHQAMRASFEKTFGSVDEVVEPSADYLSTKMEEVENGEIVASSLSEVTSKKKVKTLGIQTSVDAGGHVRIVKQRNKGSLPQNTEELRTILRVEGNAWVFLGSKYRNKVFFKDMTPSVWLDYSNYLLGVKVCLMQIPSPSGKGKTDQVALRPPWTVMINYEFELRKEAIRRAFRDSRPLSETLRSPIALQNRSMPAPARGTSVRTLGSPGNGAKARKALERAKERTRKRARSRKERKAKAMENWQAVLPMDVSSALLTRLLDVQVTVAWCIVAKSEGALASTPRGSTGRITSPRLMARPQTAKTDFGFCTCSVGCNGMATLHGICVHGFQLEMDEWDIHRDPSFDLSSVMAVHLGENQVRTLRCSHAFSALRVLQPCPPSLLGERGACSFEKLPVSLAFSLAVCFESS